MPQDRHRNDGSSFQIGVSRALRIASSGKLALVLHRQHSISSQPYPKVMIDGQMDAGAWSCGMVVGLIHDIPTVKELIDRIMREAEQIIRGRLTGLLDGTRDTKPTRGVA